MMTRWEMILKAYEKGMATDDPKERCPYEAAQFARAWQIWKRGRAR